MGQGRRKIDIKRWLNCNAGIDDIRDLTIYIVAQDKIHNWRLDQSLVFCSNSLEALLKIITQNIISPSLFCIIISYIIQLYELCYYVCGYIYVVIWDVQHICVYRTSHVCGYIFFCLFCLGLYHVVISHVHGSNLAEEIQAIAFNSHNI